MNVSIVLGSESPYIKPSKLEKKNRNRLECIE